jgi:hypothetical protein
LIAASASSFAFAGSTLEILIARRSLSVLATFIQVE